MKKLLLVLLVLFPVLCSAQVGWGVSGEIFGILGDMEVSGAVQRSPAAAPAVATPVYQDGDYINVKSAPYNAKGDGINNDIEEIDTAMGAAFAQGKDLWFPPGTYLVGEANNDRSMVRLKPGVRVFGDGNTSIIKRIEVSGSIACGVVGIDYTSLYADSTRNNFTVDHLKIQGASGRGYEIPGTSSNDMGLMFYIGATTRIWSATIDHVTVRDVNKEAIAVWDCDSVSITDCAVINANHDAYNPAMTRKLIMTGNTADSVSFGVEHEGQARYAVANPITRALISNNTFTNVYEYGINVTAGDTIIIDNNSITSYDTTADYFQVGTGVFVNNVTSPRGYKDMGKVTISNNTISGFTKTSIGNYNMVLDATNGTIGSIFITDNHLTRAGCSALYFKMYDSTKLKFISITGDSISNWNRVTESNAYLNSAISFTYVDSALVTNNRMYNNLNILRNDPLYLDYGRKLVFETNNMEGTHSQYNDIWLHIRRTVVAGIDTNDGNSHLSALNVYPVRDTITASTGDNGTISPTGTVLVWRGNNQTFTMTPDEDYTHDSTAVDGVDTLTAGTYTFTNVAANHTIAAAFKLGSVPIAFDAAASSNAAGNTVTVSFTVGDGSNTYLVVGTILQESMTATAAYNGTAMTQLGTITMDGRVIYMWGLVAPTAGTHNLVITPSSYANAATCISSWTGVHQTTPTRTLVVDAGSDGAAESITLSSSTGDICVGIGGGENTTATPNYTQRADVQAVGGNRCNMQSTTVVNPTLTWTFSPEYGGVAMGVPLRQANP